MKRARPKQPTPAARRGVHKRERREGQAEVELELPYLEPVRTEAWAYEQPCNEVERMSDIARW